MNSKYCVGETTAAATINGPGEVKLQNLQIDKAHVEVLYRSKSGVPSITDKLRERIIRETCESAISSVLYPRSSIILQIHEIENTCGVSHSYENMPEFSTRYSYSCGVIYYDLYISLAVGLCCKCVLFGFAE